MLKVFKDEKLHFETLTRIVGKFRDQHNKLTFFTPTTLAEFQKISGDSFAFSSLNPTGHYFLKLDNPNHREVAKILLFINKQNYDRIVKGEAFDRSQWQNKSCFRNEKINKGSFKWSPAFVLPPNDNFECDFVYLPPSRGLREEDQISDDSFSLFKEWFATKAMQLHEHQQQEREFDPSDSEKVRKLKQAMPPIKSFPKELA